MNAKNEPVPGSTPAVILLQGKTKTNLDKTMDGKKLAAGNYVMSVVSEGRLPVFSLPSSSVCARKPICAPLSRGHSGGFAVAVLWIRSNSISFVLPDRAAALQNGNNVGLRTSFAAADCGIVSANWRRCYAVLCALRDSSGCDLVFIHRSGADRCNLFLGIGTETLATHYRAAFLLFAALAQHARRSGRIRGGEGEPPW